MTNTIKVTVWQQEAGPEREPWPESFEAPFGATTTVLDVLDWAKAGPAPTLAYRSSCRSGICGSCAVTVNGRPVLACETGAARYRKSGLTIQPLARIKVLRDLITDMDGFIAKLRESLTWHLPVGNSGDDGGRDSGPCRHTGATRRNDEGGAAVVVDDNTGATRRNDEGGAAVVDDEPRMRLDVDRQTPAQLAAYRDLSQCINCLICYAACPVFPQLAGQPNPAADPPTEQQPGFFGPAALALSQRWNLDSRDDGAEQRHEATLENELGAWPCTQDGACTRMCPKGVDPKKAIGALQRLALA